MVTGMKYFLLPFNMTLKLHEFPACLDYFDVIDIVQKKHNVDIDDYAGMFSKETIEANKIIKKNWLIENDYADWEHVLDVPNPENQREDWPRDSPEMTKRIEINEKYRAVEKVLEARVPYLNYWHRICDEVNRGGDTDVYIGDVDPDEKLPEKYQNWVNEIHKMIRDEVKDSPAYDEEEEMVTFYIDW